ncbi:MAG: hypothetical protein IT373_03205, partial [Polyangiaceae bacterium]|nr:hypothetical protein [Polyangiaceae bacterium]
MAKRPHARRGATGGATLLLAVASCARATPAAGSLVGPPTATPPVRPETAVLVAPTSTPSGLGATDDPPPPPPAPQGIDFDALRRLPAPPSQARTPPVHAATVGTTLRRKWVAAVGRTTFRTTMATAPGPGGVAIVIGTHGATLGGADEPSDGVYVLDGATGRVRTTIRPPGTGDL